MLFFKKSEVIFETKKTRISRNRGAAIFAMILLTVSISLIIILGFTTPLIREFQNARNNLYTTQSYYAAEASNEDAYYRVKNNMLYDTFEQLVVGGATSSVSITGPLDDKVISASSSVNSRVRKVESRVSKSVYSVDLQQNAVFADEGGIRLNNNASIQGSAGKKGNVYSNGPIKGGTVTGNAISASQSIVDFGAQSAICNADVLVGKTSSQEDYAQSFIPSASSTLSSVSLYIKKTGDHGHGHGHGPATLRIVADNGSNSPQTTTLASTRLSGVGTSYYWVSFVFQHPPALVEGQKYWIVLDADEPSTREYFTWCKDASDSYANGSPAYNNDWHDGSWTNTTGDMTFKTFSVYGRGSIENVQVGVDARADLIKDSNVTRDAYFQTLDNTNVHGVEYATSTDPAQIQMPISDAEIDRWKADSTDALLLGGTFTGNYSTTTTPVDLGPKYITGNLTVASYKTLNITGTLYVQGNILIDDYAVIQCSSVYGPNGCIVIADGTITLDRHAQALGSGTTGSFILFVSTKTGGSDVTAITISNDAVANNGILYAPYSKVYIQKRTDVAAILGYKVELGDSVDVIYQPQLDTLDFIPTSTGGGIVWTINSWNEIE
jgi:hypothetical protein